jgi:hypothetical protein
MTPENLSKLRDRVVKAAEGALAASAKPGVPRRVGGTNCASAFDT